MDSTKITPFKPSINGILKSNHWSSIKLMEPLVPKSNFIATAPTNGGIIKGINPKLWIRTDPLKLNRAVK